jgi:hypothetical protein
MRYAITLAVTTDIHLTDEQARDIAARWAHNGGFDLGLTSTSRDEPWLRVSGLVKASDEPDPAQIVQAAAGNLRIELAAAGARVKTWEAIEVLSEAEVEQRARRLAIPPMVNAAEFAELAGYKTRQAIYQLESDRATGKRSGFPAPVLDGYWLRSAAEHWARTRRRKPGPAPRSSAPSEDA